MQRFFLQILLPSVNVLCATDALLTFRFRSPCQFHFLPSYSFASNRSLVASITHILIFLRLITIFSGSHTISTPHVPFGNAFHFSLIYFLASLPISVANRIAFGLSLRSRLKHLSIHISRA